MRDLIKNVLELEKTKGQPFNSVKLKQARKELTDRLLEDGKEFLEIDNYVLKIAYTNKDKEKPYITIYTKESYKICQDFLRNNKK